MIRETKDLLNDILSQAEKNGAQSADLILSRGKSLSMSSQQKKLDKYNVSSSQVIGIRIVKDNRVGISYSESLDKSATDFMIKSAIENAKNSFENKDESIEFINMNDTIEAEDKYNVVDNVPAEDKINLAIKLESIVYEKDNRVEACPYNGLSESESEYYYINSPGTFCFHKERVVSCYTSALIAEGGVKSMHYHGEKARSFDSLNWNNCVDESLKHAAYWLKGKPIPTGSYDVVFTADALNDLFDCFPNMFSGKATYQKRNPLYEKIGNEIFHKDLTIMDSPYFDRAFYFSGFDDEGYERADLKLIENGVYKHVMHNSVTAKQMNAVNTYHASRSPRSGLGVSGTNLIISSGEASESEVLTNKVFEIHSFQGIGSGSDAISGDFSAAASGYLLKNGEISQPVKGVTVAGNFYEMLKNIACIGSKLEASNSSVFYSPKIRFENLSIAGN